MSLRAKSARVTTKTRSSSGMSAPSSSTFNGNSSSRGYPQPSSTGSSFGASSLPPARGNSSSNISDNGHNISRPSSSRGGRRLHSARPSSARGNSYSSSSTASSSAASSSVTAAKSAMVRHTSGGNNDTGGNTGIVHDPSMKLTNVKTTFSISSRSLSSRVTGDLTLNGETMQTPTKRPTTPQSPVIQNSRKGEEDYCNVKKHKKISAECDSLRKALRASQMETDTERKRAETTSRDLVVEKSETAKWKGKAAKSAKECESAKSEKEKIKKRMQSLEAELKAIKDKEAERKKNDQELKKKKRDVVETCKECENLKAVVGKLEALREELLRENDNQARQHETQLKSAESDRDEARKWFSDSEISKASLQGKYDVLTSEMEKVKSEMSALKLELASAKKGEEELKRKLDDEMASKGCSGCTKSSKGDGDIDDDDDSFPAVLARELRLMSEAYEDKLRLERQKWTIKEFEYRESMRALNDTARSERMLLKGKITMLEAEISRLKSGG